MKQINVTMKDLEYLKYAVMGEYDNNTVISLHQHPDAAAAFIATSPRDDLVINEINIKKQ